MSSASEYGSIPDDAVSFLISSGFITADDCSMVVASGRGEYARSMSRAVRVLVCMDMRAESLEHTHEAVLGGCRTELYEKDWNSYVLSRGRYDSCLLSPSRLCFNMDSILRMESVSSRSCIVVLPSRSDKRRFTKALIQSTGVMLPLPGFPDVEPIKEAILSSGRDVVTRDFTSIIECPAEDMVRSMVASCPKGSEITELESRAYDVISSSTTDGMVRYTSSVVVLAWNL